MVSPEMLPLALSLLSCVSFIVGSPGACLLPLFLSSVPELLWGAATPVIGGR